MTRKRSGEFALIERYFRPLAADPGAFALTDDAAIYRPRAGEELVLTTDLVAAGIHFFPDDPPDLIARKALRVNLSDLAAKGAEPVGYLVSQPGWQPIRKSTVSRFWVAIPAGQAAG